MKPSTPTLQRPTLLPGLRRLWRTPHTLQLGVDPACAVVLELANPAVAKLLDLLDGAHSERSVLAHAARYGVADSDARTLLDTLRTAGLVVGAQALVPGHLAPPVRRRLTAEAAALAVRRTGQRTAATPAQILRHRAAARVMVTGRGRLGPAVALALAHAGVGQVSPALDGTVEPADAVAGGLLAADLGRPRSAAVAEAIQRTVPGTDTRPIRRGEASFVVQTTPAGPARLHAATYARYRLAHLVATVRDGAAVVGPLVPPTGSPCLNCLDLHRTDRDPAWPKLAAQLATAAATDAGPGDGEPCAAPTLLAAAGFAAAEVLAYLDGRVAGNRSTQPQTLGATVEIESAGRHRRRTWPPHPDCDCSRHPRRR
jgi:ThiF family